MNKKIIVGMYVILVPNSEFLGSIQRTAKIGKIVQLIMHKRVITHMVRLTFLGKKLFSRALLRLGIARSV